MNTWEIHAQHLQVTVERLLEADVPDLDLLDALNYLQNSLGSLHSMKSSLWRRVLSLSRDTFTWQPKEHNG